ncbi:RHS repeat-associated core domain-containing protein, partial [Hafnia alvei]
PKHISWFGWDGDKLVLTERDGTRIHTVYLHHSFVPLLRFEGDKPPTITPLADKLEQEVGITLPPDFKQTLHHIEQALRANRLSTEQHTWLNQIQLSPEYLATLVDPLPDTPYAAQLYDCNHLGTPQQLINLNGDIDWSITLDAWGNALSEENPHQLHQPIRMQGQQYDEESGLHYNRHRYYDPTIGRYITQDPIGLRGGLNFYGYPLDPVIYIDPLGLACSAGTHAISSNPADTKKLQDALQSYLNKGIVYGTGANQLVCNQLVDRSINQAFPNTVQGEPNTHQMRAGIGPFSRTNTPKPGDLALMTTPGHIVVVTGVNENDQVSQFIGSQTS